MIKHKVDPKRLPEEEVLAISKTGDILVGYLHFDESLELVDCEDESTLLLNVTHYILKSDILKLKEE